MQPPEIPKYPYVYWHNPSLRWYARVRIHGEFVHLGFFTDQADAIRAVDEFCREFGLASSGRELQRVRGARMKETALERFRAKHAKGRIEKVFDITAIPPQAGDSEED